MSSFHQASASLKGVLDKNSAKYETLISDWLSALIAQRSTLHNEAGVIKEASRIIGDIGLDSRRIPLSADIVTDEFYSMPDGVPTDPWVEKDNIVVGASHRPSGDGKSLILCSHLDVVDASTDFTNAFSPSREGSRIVGRGAADSKGSAVSMLLAFKMLKDAGLQLDAPAEMHLVIEEEIGGNGALALIRQHPRADGVIVGEPTSLNVHPANRGGLWFRLTTYGLATHMGQAHKGVNAIEKAMEAIRLLRQYEQQLLQQSRGYRLFERYEHPVQLNIGTIHGGIMPAMVAEKTVVEGGIGFLPNKTLADVEQALHRAILSGDDQWLKTHYELDFKKIRNDAYEIPADHPLPQMLSRSCQASGQAGEVFGWNVSCDARLYANLGNMPTVVFGPGDIRQAHATGEHIDIAEILKAAEILARFVISWCGVTNQ